MQIKYYETAWNDISNSERWFGKLSLLSLVSLIPVFGQIVTYGYLYGWAREIAWGVHEPMPARIFENSDGKLYRRGWFILVLVFVFSLVPSIILGVGSLMQQVVSVSLMSGDASAVEMGAGAAIGGLVSFIGIALSLIISLFAWIGSMRIAVYDRLSSGFQLGKLWSMFRHDTNGILRIFGMSLILSLIVGFILSIVITMLFVLVVFAGIGGLASAGYSVESLNYMTDAQVTEFLLRFIASAGFVGIACSLVAAFLSALGLTYVEALVARALGYWTMQFDVPHWRGQDEPMPFEASAMQQQAYQQQAQQPYQAQPVQQAQQPYQAQQAQPSYQAQQPYQGQVPLQAQPYQQAAGESLYGTGGQALQDPFSQGELMAAPAQASAQDALDGAMSYAEDVPPAISDESAGAIFGDEQETPDASR